MDHAIDIKGLVDPDALRAAWAHGNDNVVQLRLMPPVGDAFNHREAGRVARKVLAWARKVADESGVDPDRVVVSVRLNRDGVWGGRLAGLCPGEG